MVRCANGCGSALIFLGAIALGQNSPQTVPAVDHAQKRVEPGR
jgi:hypothetical protein